MKAYTKPTAEVIKLHIENSVALVIASNPDANTVSGTTDARWTRRRMWDEEEEEQ